MWCELWGPFLSATSQSIFTTQDNLDSRIFSTYYFHCKLQNFCKFKMYQISKLFAMDYIFFVPICNVFVPQYNSFENSLFIKFAINLQMDGWTDLFFQKFCTHLQCYSKWIVKYAFIHCSTEVQNNCKKTLVKCRKTKNFYKLIAKVLRNLP